jgi:GalNAc-alpha-(1->4)-GalNAc-alpha-(1->3)-diNAcBac-PP-undecaprenol alpha-1,4-N-acetyl-D-galactosaminyltransferase
MSNILTTIAGKFTGIPVIISERNNPKYEATAAFWKFLRKYVYGSASILVVQTDAVKKFYLPFIKHKKIRVIPNPISESLSQQRKLDSTKERIILNVGRFTWQKNQKMLIRAFSKIAPMDWKLVIVGKGKLENELKNEIEASGLSHAIELKGPNSEIHEMYNRAGIFAFPSRFEGFPNALLEALHFGIPSISTDCPYGPSELIKSCENGFLIESDNQAQLEEMLKLLIEDQTLRDLMSRNAIESTESFRESKIIEIWNSLFKEFLTQPE